MSTASLRVEWDAFTAEHGNLWFAEYDDKTVALANELARLFQADPPSMGQVSYFIEDADAVSRDVSDAPWTIRKSHMPNQRFTWLVLINDVLCGLEGDEQPELTVLGRLPLDWEEVAS